VLELLQRLGIEEENSGVFTNGWRPGEGELFVSRSPVDGATLASARGASPREVDDAIQTATDIFARWRETPAPARGDIVRQIGDALRAKKDDLGLLVTLEMGKSLSEGLGEVQEMIDMADFCVGLSRQLYGKSMHSERPGHRMYEQWHPLGPVGVITAFNFPVAVWSWNAFVALVSGDPVIWKPSEQTPLTAIAVHKLVEDVLAPAGWSGLCSLIVGGADVGAALAKDARVPLVSATGSTRMGREVAPVVAARFGRCLLELGGNNALAVMEDADLDLAVRAIVFGAVGTCGQRCTSTRRVLAHRGIAAELEDRLVKAYASLRIGDPREPSMHVGPLVSSDAVQKMQDAIVAIRAQGGEIITGGETLDDGGCYVRPCLVRAKADLPMMREETFAPILYLVSVDDIDDAIARNNEVSQGLSSAVFTTDLRKSERFLGAAGSDCGIANVNIGTSGAEIGGAFGGEKETGGGREAGSDAWKAYMRRQTCTLNYTSELPLAQGVEF
jgi:aldehyde dehydrogenase (NAD+)